MSLKISIGKTSNDELVIKDICGLPHLFVSVSYEAQLQLFLQQLLEQISIWRKGDNLQLAIALNKSISPINNHIVEYATHKMLYNPEEAKMTSSKDAFVKGIYKEMVARIRQRKKNKSKQIDFPLLLIVIDELFDIVLTQKKQTGLCFLQLLILGHQVNMHIIAASASTYRNLLIQLVHLHPSIEQQLNSNKLLGGKTIIKPLGAEMVLTPDDLVFFKTIDVPIYERYFPIIKH